MTAVEIYEQLKIAFDALAAIHGKLENDVSTDTAFAVGEALGVVMKAKGLIGRDIDDAKGK